MLFLTRVSLGATPTAFSIRRSPSWPRPVSVRIVASVISEPEYSPFTLGYIQSTHTCCTNELKATELGNFSYFL